MNKEGRGRPSKKRVVANEVDVDDALLLDVKGELSGSLVQCEEDGLAPRKMPRRAATCLSFKEEEPVDIPEDSLIEIKEYETANDEIEALLKTKTGPEVLLPTRKLKDFVLHDAEISLHPFELSGTSDVFISGVVLPFGDVLEKDKDVGIKCRNFARVQSWSISGYDEGSPEICITTSGANYICLAPARKYKGFYDQFYLKACVCVEVYKKLARSKGGNPHLALEELLAGVARSMSGRKDFPVGPCGMEFVASLGNFIYDQLSKLDKIMENDGVAFSTLGVVIALREQCAENRCKNLSILSGGVLKIDEKVMSKAHEDEDEKLARLLQEEEEWKYRKNHGNGRNMASRKQFYIKINEDEIANDYPLPAYYKPSVQEMDEYIFFDDMLNYYDLPRRVLSNWSLYNSDSRFVSLELLPMKPGVEDDFTIFGSGQVKEDDGSGFCLENDHPKISSSTSNMAEAEGVSIYLGAIKEWMIEFGSSMIFISLRTDMAWYRLEKPATKYSPWFEPVKKVAKLAISIIGLLKEQSRVARLSFVDVVKRVSEFEKGNPAYIASNPKEVERYIVVHGQIILQQFDDFPDKNIRKCAFLDGLLKKMEERHHTKLLLKKKVVCRKGANLNPSASLVPTQSKRKVMRATMTRLINRIWSDYYSNCLPGDSVEGEDRDSKEDEELEEVEEENEEEELEDTNISLQEVTHKLPLPSVTRTFPSNVIDIVWQGEPSGELNLGGRLFKSVIVHGMIIEVGSVIVVNVDESEEIILVEFLFEKSSGRKMVHGRVMKKGSQTVLGNAANERELFLTNECMEVQLSTVKELMVVDFKSKKWGYKYRKDNAIADRIEREMAEERQRKGPPIRYYCKSLYWPQKGAFLALPFGSIGLGNGECSACKAKEQLQEFILKKSKDGFIYKNTDYQLNVFVYIKHESFSSADYEYERFKAGRNVGLKPYGVCQLLGITLPKGSVKPNPMSTSLNVRRFYRPEDISAEKAYSSDIREIFYTEEVHNVPVEFIEGKCEVRKKAYLENSSLPVILEHVFFCEYSYDPANGAITQLPFSIQNQLLTKTAIDEAILRRSKGKGKCDESVLNNEMDQAQNALQDRRLATLDIFAGCGGLSEGLQRSGVSLTKWAIEYEPPAGEAFSENHPDALVFIDNCNVTLRAIMEECGDTDDCISTAEACELASKFDEEKRKKLPFPGQVEFINGGPPCQGFSGMNRFNQGTWSKVQCEMILAFLSFADYFRPKYFLLENVRNFVSFNRGQTFRLTLASLLEMGYQVRFGILEAGAYGVSQSRKRAFIWAASPEEILPEWPEPMHVFAGPELKISLPGGVQYAAVRSTAGGAPFRSITVRDTIGDLPPVSNGASKSEIEYDCNPISWFQRQIRASMMVLHDHISKEMNELNLIRCKRIPQRPGADWRDLPDEKVTLSTGQRVDLIPWCLPNTAKRHNQWKGLFGRLDWEGNFPTSITDPQPMGKVGMCFHPEQNRILTVRECARSQGFPDSYKFSGNIQSKHRQIGNAVPPPLAYALGRKLKEAVDKK